MEHRGGSCYVWLLATNILPRRFTQVVADARISFLNFSGWKRSAAWTAPFCLSVHRQGTPGGSHLLASVPSPWPASILQRLRQPAEGMPGPPLPLPRQLEGRLSGSKNEYVHSTTSAPGEVQPALLKRVAHPRLQGWLGPPPGQSPGLRSGQVGAGRPLPTQQQETLAGLGRHLQPPGVSVIRYILPFMGCRYSTFPRTAL